MRSGLVDGQPPKLQESLPVPNRQQRAIAASKSFGRWMAPLLLALWSRKWPVIGVLVATVLLAMYGQTLVLGPRVTAVAAEQGLFLQTVVASGHV